MPKHPLLNPRVSRELSELRRTNHDIMRRADTVVDFGCIGHPESNVRIGWIDFGEIHWTWTPFQRANFPRGSNEKAFRAVDRWLASNAG